MFNKFEKRALVYIKEDVEVGKDYGDIHVFDVQEDKLGTVGVVVDVDGEAVKVGKFWWHKSCLRLVKYHVAGFLYA